MSSLLSYTASKLLTDDSKLKVTRNQVTNRLNNNREFYEKKYIYENIKQQIENKKKAKLKAEKQNLNIRFSFF